MSSGRLEAEFKAKVLAWETSNEDRKKAIDSWKEYESDVLSDVDTLRKQISSLQGTIDALAKQRDDLIKSTTTQNETLTVLQSSHQSLSDEVEKLKGERTTLNEQKAALEKSISESTTKKLAVEVENEQMVEKGRKLKAALPALEEQNKTAETNLRDQTEQLTKATMELQAIQAKIVEADVLIKSKSMITAELAEKEVTLAETTKELETLRNQVDAEKAAIAKASMELTILKAEVTTTQTTRDKEQTILATIQGDLEKARTELDGLRKQEQQLAKEIATATTEFSFNAEVAAKSLASLSKTAAETLQQIADKATELNNALKNIAVPSPPASPTETEANKTTPEQGSDN